MKNHITFEYKHKDPENFSTEIVERKGLGHPDTLADGLANAISVAYSQHCLNSFGYVLHHNVDKLYIGGGMFVAGYKRIKRIAPIKVVVNGRFTDSFGSKKINLKKIQKQAIENYVKMIIPAIDVKKDISIDFNATQNNPNLSNPYWYKPRSVEDLPEQQNLVANDTSVVIASSPPTATERLTIALEKFFWVPTKTGIKPKFSYYGQDIKVMSIRNGKKINCTLCVPVLSKFIASDNEYVKRVKFIERALQKYANNFLKKGKFSAFVKVNPSKDPATPRKYILGLGSCVEGGEEGVVGRGNHYNGVISVCRPSSVEAPFGKNPFYHTGRVLANVLTNISQRIYKETGEKNTLIGITKNQHSLLPPTELIVHIQTKKGRKKIENIIEEEIKKDYLTQILGVKIIY